MDLIALFGGLLLGLLGIVLCFFLPNLASLVLGLIFVKFKKTRLLGVRFLAMSMIRHDLCPKYCECDCSNTPCKNWTCPNYSSSQAN